MATECLTCLHWIPVDSCLLNKKPYCIEHPVDTDTLLVRTPGRLQFDASKRTVDLGVVG